MTKPVIYDHHFATFMETLTKSEPGEWFESFCDACKWWNIEPQEMIDAMEDIRINNKNW